MTLLPEIILHRLVLPSLVRRTLSTSQVKMVWPTVHETSELVSVRNHSDIHVCVVISCRSTKLDVAAEADVDMINLSLKIYFVFPSPFWRRWTMSHPARRGPESKLPK